MEYIANLNTFSKRFKTGNRGRGAEVAFHRSVAGDADKVNASVNDKLSNRPEHNNTDSGKDPISKCRHFPSFQRDRFRNAFSPQVERNEVSQTFEEITLVILAAKADYPITDISTV